MWMFIEVQIRENDEGSTQVGEGVHAHKEIDG